MTKKKTVTRYHLDIQVHKEGPTFLDICGHLLVDKTGQERHFDDREMDDYSILKRLKPTEKFNNYKIFLAAEPWPYIRVQLSSVDRHMLFSVDTQEFDKLKWHGNTTRKIADVVDVHDLLFIHLIATKKKVDG